MKKGWTESEGVMSSKVRKIDKAERVALQIVRRLPMRDYYKAAVLRKAGMK